MVFALRNRVSQKLLPAAVATLALLAATASNAAVIPPEVAFDDGGTSGGILFTWDGTAGGVSNVVVLPILDFTSNATTIPGTFSTSCTACSLTFQTGPISYNGSTWSFGAGGSLSIDISNGGNLDLTLAGGPNLAGPANLLTGAFTEAEFVNANGAPKFFLGNGDDTKNQAIVDTFFGGLNAFTFAKTTIAGVFTVTDPNTGAFEFAISQVDVTNQHVPEPAGTTALLLLGLSGLGAARIRRRR